MSFAAADMPWYLYDAVFAGSAGVSPASKDIGPKARPSCKGDTKAGVPPIHPDSAGGTPALPGKARPAKIQSQAKLQFQIDDIPRRRRDTRNEFRARRTRLS